MDATPLGNLLKELRHGAGLSQRAAAAAVGVSFPHISKIEAGHEVPSAELLVALAKAYKVDHDGLLLAADRLPEDVEEAVIEKKDLAPQFLRSWRSGKISDEDVRRLLDKSDDGGTSSVDNLVLQLCDRSHNVQRMDKSPAGHRLRVRRVECRLTQEQLADLAGVSRRSISKAEAGGRLLRSTRQAIERALGLEVGALRDDAEVLSR